jgi:hypothetical protein
MAICQIKRTSILLQETWYSKYCFQNLLSVMIVNPLLRLTFNTTLAELTSLEQLLCTLMSQNHIPEEVIDKLWAVYSKYLKIC